MVYPRIVTFTKRQLVNLPLGSTYGWIEKRWFDLAIERGVLHENDYGQFIVSDIDLFNRFHAVYDKYEKEVRKNDEMSKIVEQFSINK